VSGMVWLRMVRFRDNIQQYKQFRHNFQSESDWSESGFQSGLRSRWKIFNQGLMKKFQSKSAWKFSIRVWLQKV